MKSTVYPYTYSQNRYNISNNCQLLSKLKDSFELLLHFIWLYSLELLYLKVNGRFLLIEAITNGSKKADSESLLSIFMESTRWVFPRIGGFLPPKIIN